MEKKLTIFNRVIRATNTTGRIVQGRLHVIRAPGGCRAEFRCEGQVYALTLRERQCNADALLERVRMAYEDLGFRLRLPPAEYDALAAKQAREKHLWEVAELAIAMQASALQLM